MATRLETAVARASQKVAFGLMVWVGKTRRSTSPKRSQTMRLRDVGLNSQDRCPKCPVAAAGKLWRGRKRFHPRRGQSHRGLRQFLGCRGNLINSAAARLDHADLDLARLFRRAQLLVPRLAGIRLLTSQSGFDATSHC